MGFGEDFSSEEQRYILLAYYFGRQRLLNCIALQQITQDLIDAFEAKPRNSTTKYFDPPPGCCLCKEKEDIFKRLWQDYHDQKHGKKGVRPDTKAAGGAWKDILQFWTDVEKQNESSPSDENLLLSFQNACKDVLQKHQVDICSENKEKYSEQQALNNWSSLIENVKKKLHNCHSSIFSKSGSVTAVGKTNGFTKQHGLQSVLLTFLIEKRARTYAKRLQSCRGIGLMIRATRDPMAVVAKYSMCEKCIGNGEESHDRHRSILDVLSMFNDQLGIGPKPEEHDRLIAQPNCTNSKEDIPVEEYDQVEVIMDGNAAESLMPGVAAGRKRRAMPNGTEVAEDTKSDTTVRKSRRAQMSNKNYRAFVYDMSDVSATEEDESAERKSKPKKIFKRRSSLPPRRQNDKAGPSQNQETAISKEAPVLIQPGSAKLESGTPTKFILSPSVSNTEKTNVVIVTNSKPSTSSVKNIPELAPISAPRSTQSRSSSEFIASVPLMQSALKAKPSGLCLPSGVMVNFGNNPTTSETLKMLTKPRRMSSNSIVSTAPKLVLIPANCKSTVMTSQSGPLKIVPIQLRGRSTSLDGQPMGGLLMQNSVQVPNEATAIAKQANIPQHRTTTVQGKQSKPFLVQVVDSQSRPVNPGCVVPSAVEGAKVHLTQFTPPVMSNPTKPLSKVVQLNSSAVKIFKSVSIAGQSSSSSNRGSFVKLNSVSQTKVSNVQQKMPVVQMVPVPMKKIDKLGNVPMIKLANPPYINIPKLQTAFGKNLFFEKVTIQMNGQMPCTGRKPGQPVFTSPLLQTLNRKIARPTKPPKMDVLNKLLSFNHPRKVIIETQSPLKTPGKRKAAKPAVSNPVKSIPLVVAEYIQSLLPSDEKGPKPVKHRSKEIKPSLLMPIPYETNFLCINDTIEKYGWKAYWFRKCRCSKVREKAAEANMAREEHDDVVQLDEVATWIPKQLSERTKLILSGKLSDENEVEKAPGEDLVVTDSSKTRRSLEFTVENPSDVVIGPMNKNDVQTTGQAPVVNFEVDDKKCCLDTSSKPAGEVMKRRASESEDPQVEGTTPGKRLKAVYRRDKNGNWSAASSGDAHDFQLVSDTVVLNIKPGQQLVTAEEQPTMEDRMGITHDHGLKRSARATMLRRKSLVKRGFDAEMKTKAGRERTSVAATKPCLFMQFSDASRTAPKFKVITPSSSCFRSYPNVLNRVTKRAEERKRQFKLLCTPPEPSEVKKRRDRNNEDLVLLLNSSVSPSTMKRSTKRKVSSAKNVKPSTSTKSIELNKDATKESFEGLLIGRLESLWNAGQPPEKPKQKQPLRKKSVLAMLPRVQEAMANQPEGDVNVTDTTTDNLPDETNKKLVKKQSTGSLLNTMSEKHVRAALTAMSKWEILHTTKTNPFRSYKSRTFASCNHSLAASSRTNSSEIAKVDKSKGPASLDTIERANHITAVEEDSTIKITPSDSEITADIKTAVEITLDCDATEAKLPCSSHSLPITNIQATCTDLFEDARPCGPKSLQVSGTKVTNEFISIDAKLPGVTEQSTKTLSRKSTSDGMSSNVGFVKDVISPDTDSGLGTEPPEFEQQQEGMIGEGDVENEMQKFVSDASKSSDTPAEVRDADDYDGLCSYLDDLFPDADLNNSLKNELLSPHARASFCKSKSPAGSPSTTKENTEDGSSVSATVCSYPPEFESDLFDELPDLLKEGELKTSDTDEKSSNATSTAKGALQNLSKIHDNQLSLEASSALETTVASNHPAGNTKELEELEKQSTDAFANTSPRHKDSCISPGVWKESPSQISTKQSGIASASMKISKIGSQGPQEDEIRESMEYLLSATCKTVDEEPDTTHSQPALARTKCGFGARGIVQPSVFLTKPYSFQKGPEAWYVDAHALTAKMHGFKVPAKPCNLQKVNKGNSRQSYPGFVSIYEELKRAVKHSEGMNRTDNYVLNASVEFQLQKRVKSVDRISSFLGKTYTLSRLEEMFPSGIKQENLLKKRTSAKRYKEKQCRPSKLASRQTSWIKSHVNQYLKKRQANYNMKRLKAIIGESYRKTGVSVVSGTPNKQISGSIGSSPYPTPQKPSELASTPQNVCDNSEQSSGFSTPEVPRGMLFSKYKENTDDFERSLLERSPPSDLQQQEQSVLFDFDNRLNGSPTLQLDNACPSTVDCPSEHDDFEDCITDDISQQKEAQSDNATEAPQSPQVCLLAEQNNNVQPYLELLQPNSPAGSSGLDDASCPFTLGQSPSPVEKRPRKRQPVSADTLNGSYWSAELDVDDDWPSTSAKRALNLRKRRNKEEDERARRKKVNKRKRPGHGHTLSSMEQTGVIMEAERFLLERYRDGSLLDNGSDEEPAEMTPLRSLFSMSLNVERVRSWMRDSTSAKPMRLLLSKLPPMMKRVRTLSTEKDSHSDSFLSIMKRTYRKETNTGTVKRRKRREEDRAYFSDSESHSRGTKVVLSPRSTTALMRKPIVSLVRCSYPISPRRESPTTQKPKRTFSSPRSMAQICAKKTTSNMRVDENGKLVLRKEQESETNPEGEKEDAEEGTQLRITRPYMGLKRRLVFSHDGRDDQDGPGADGGSVIDLESMKIIDPFISLPKVLPIASLCTGSELPSIQRPEFDCNEKSASKLPTGGAENGTDADTENATQKDDESNNFSVKEWPRTRPRRRSSADKTLIHADNSGIRSSKSRLHDLRVKNVEPLVTPPSESLKRSGGDDGKGGKVPTSPKKPATESPPVLRDPKKLQALRETVFNELKTKTSRNARPVGRHASNRRRTLQSKFRPQNKSSPGPDSRSRSRLQATCSTKGSFISRLIEYDSSDFSADDEAK